MVANDFGDVIVLTVSTVACLYVVCFLSKMIESTRLLSKALAYIGMNSFYIMGLHFFGFKMATLALNVFGGNYSLANLVPPVGANFALFILYAICGVGFPLTVIFIIRLLKRIIVKNL